MTAAKTLLISVVLLAYLSQCSGQSFPALNHIISKVSSEDQQDAVNALITRLIGVQAEKFRVYIHPEIGPKFRDTFQIWTDSYGRINITASSGVAGAMGFYYYLKNYCEALISWGGRQISLPAQLPVPSKPVVITSNDRFRYYQNVCTVSYSSVWWTWERWEQEIDWMAMQGINFPLAFTAQETIWQRVFLKMGFSQADLDTFFSGPAFLAWQRMGNLQGWGGPLSQSWHDQQTALQHLILKRMRSLGILPILPAFAGHVPGAITKLYPNASVSPLSTWGNMPDNYTKVLLLDFADPLFTQIGSAFIKEYTKEFGTDHVYNTDTFNEMTPKSGDPSYLSQAGAAVFRAMTVADPDAIWVMQGWLFLSSFWSDDRIEALCTSVPQGKMIVLDLYSDVQPLYNRTKFYYGQPFIWCMLHDFGGTVAMYGALESINKGPSLARTLPNSTMVGIGLTPEGINQNEVIYEFMMENTWSGPRSLAPWLSQYATRRYGQSNGHVDKAWHLLGSTIYNSTEGHGQGHNLIALRPATNCQPDASVYNNTSTSRKDHEGHGRNLITHRPSMHPTTDIWYDTDTMFEAWDQFILAADQLDNDLFRYDLVDVTRQSLQVSAVLFYNLMMSAYHSKNNQTFVMRSKDLIGVLEDLEALLATDEHFLLGRWVESARALGVTPAEKDLFEYNAKNQITLWGPTGNILDYANKQWSGLVKRYYLPRWELFVQRLTHSFNSGEPFRKNQFDKDVFAQVEEPFTFSKEKFPTTPIGDQILEAKRIHKSLRPRMWRWKNDFKHMAQRNTLKNQRRSKMNFSYEIILSDERTLG